MPDSCFCEAVRSSGIRQPSNTWSSLAFLIVAAMVLARWARKPQVDKRAYPLLYAFTLVVIGLGSAFLHSTLSFAGQFADVFGMYLIASFALLYSIHRLRGLSGAAFVGGYVAMNTVLAAVLYWIPEVRRVVFGLLIVAVVSVEILIRRKNAAASVTKHLWMALGLMGLAFAIWALDFTRVLCSPYSWVQGHAVWHVLSAAAAWYLFRYYSE